MLILEENSDVFANKTDDPVKKVSAFRLASTYSFRLVGINNERLNFNDGYLGLLLGLEFNESKNIFSIGANIASEETFEMFGGSIGYTKMFTRDNLVNFGMNYDVGLSVMPYREKLYDPWIEGTKIFNAGVGLEVQAVLISLRYRVGVGVGGNEIHKQKLIQHGFGFGWFFFRGKNK